MVIERKSHHMDAPIQNYNGKSIILMIQASVFTLNKTEY